MDSDSRRRTFRTVAVALGSDPDLALARARQIENGADGSESEAEAFLVVLGELCEGRV